jgi:hypothetical protein
MTPQQILTKMRAQRELRVEMGSGRSMTMLLPTELQIQRDLIKLLPGASPDDPPRATLELDPDTVHEYVVGWAGYTTSDLLGPAGGDDPAPFASVLVQEWLAEHASDVTTLTSALLTAINDRFKAKAEAEKNS